VLAFLIAVDFYTFYELFWMQEESILEIAILMGLLIALALNVVPYFLAIAFFVHVSFVDSRVKKKKKGEYTDMPAIGDANDGSTLKKLSLVVVGGALAAILLLLALVTAIRVGSIGVNRQEAIHMFDIATFVESSGFTQQDIVDMRTFNNDASGWDPHWVLANPEDAHISSIDDVRFGRYESFTLHVILVISPLVTSFMAMLLAFFYSDHPVKWMRRLMKFAGVQSDDKFVSAWKADKDEFSDEQTEKRMHRIEQLDRAETRRIESEIKRLRKEYATAQKEAARELKKAAKEAKLAEKEFVDAQKRFWQPWKKQLELLKADCDEAARQEGVNTEFAAPPPENDEGGGDAATERENFALINLMTELWAGLNTNEDCPEQIDKFIEKYYAYALMQIVESVKLNYDAGLMSIYSGIEADLETYKVQLARTFPNPVTRAIVMDIDVAKLIDAYNASKASGGGKKIQQWNTQESIDGLKESFEKLATIGHKGGQGDA